MNLNVKKLYEALDILPGYKTYSTFLFMVGMFICQAMGYHMFSEAEWGMAAGATGLFAKMGQDRKPK